MTKKRHEDLENDADTSADTPLSRRWRKHYLALGLSRTLPKVAEAIADGKLIDRAHPRPTPQNATQMKKQLATLRAVDPLWARQRTAALTQVKRWSARYDWLGAADAYDREQADEIRRLNIQREVEMRDRHYTTGKALVLTAAEDYLSAHQSGKVSATAAVQALGMGAQIERAALNLTGQRGIQGVQSFAQLLASFDQPGSLESGAGDVTVTQVNTTNNVIVQPALTVEHLRQLEASRTAQLAAYRQARGLPDPATTDPWYATLPPAPPPLEKTPRVTVSETPATSTVVESTLVPRDGE